MLKGILILDQLALLLPGYSPEITQQYLLPQLAGNIYCWFPFFAYLIVRLVELTPTKKWISSLSAISALLIAYQASFLVAALIFRNGGSATQEVFFLGRYSEGNIQHMLPGFPDRTLASFTALIVLHFSLLRGIPRLEKAICIVSVAVYALARLYLGFSHLSDVLGGLFIGFLAGKTMVIFAKNLRLVIANRKRLV